MYRVLSIIAFLLSVNLSANSFAKELTVSGKYLSTADMVVSKTKEEAVCAWAKSSPQGCYIEFAKFSSGKWEIQEKLVTIASKSSDVKVASDGTNHFIYYSDNQGLWLLETEDGCWLEPLEISSGESASLSEIAIYSKLGEIFVWVQEVDGVQQCFIDVEAEKIQLSKAKNEVTSPKVSEESGGRFHITFVEDGALKTVSIIDCNWIDKVQLSFGSGVSNFDISTNGNHTHVIWEQDFAGKKKIYCAKHTPEGWSCPETFSINKNNPSNPTIAVASNGSALAIWQEGDSLWMSQFKEEMWSNRTKFQDKGKDLRLYADEEGNFHAWWIETFENRQVIATSSLRDDSKWDEVTYLSKPSRLISPPLAGVTKKGKTIALWNIFERSKKSIEMLDFDNVLPPVLLSVNQIEEEFATERVSLIQTKWKDSPDDSVIKYRIYLNSQEEGSVAPSVGNYVMLKKSGFDCTSIGVTAVNKDGEESILCAKLLPSK